MVDMVALLQCARPPVPATTLRQLSRIIVALVVMTGRVTMLGLARWAGKGGSYRTIQRFFATVIPWATLCWVFLRQHVYRPEDVYLVGGDAVVVTKAGTPPHGLDRFFARLYGKPVPGLAFFALSLVRVQQRRSLSDARRAGGAQRRGEGHLQGSSGCQAVEGAMRHASAWTSQGQYAPRQGPPHAHPSTRADSSPVRSLAAPDHHRALGDLAGARWPLWQPQRPADGAAVPRAPHGQAAV